jgi:putative FmdB family regulatory protein
MPTYEYRCKDCGKVFEQTVTLHEHEEHKPPSCPKCKSHNVEQQPTRFQAVTSQKS